MDTNTNDNQTNNINNNETFDLLDSESIITKKEKVFHRSNSIEEINSWKKFVIEYMTDFETNLQNNFQKSNTELRMKLAEAERKLDINEIKIESIQDEAQKNQNKIDKINDLIFASRKFSDQILSNEVRLGSLQKEFSNACYKYDKIFIDNLHVPGTLGEFCTYKNLREYIEVSFSIAFAFKTDLNLHLVFI